MLISKFEKLVAYISHTSQIWPIVTLVGVVVNMRKYIEGQYFG